jgi:hypothetical protein
MLNPNEEQIIAVTKENCLKAINLKKSLDRLHSNKDFKALIVDGYQKEYAAKQVSLLADPGATKSEVHAGLQGIAELLAYFRAVEHGGIIAQRTYDEHVDLESQENNE